jgi:hypothetical protein
MNLEMGLLTCTCCLSVGLSVRLFVAVHTLRLHDSSGVVFGLPLPRPLPIILPMPLPLPGYGSVSGFGSGSRSKPPGPVRIS